MYKVVNITDAYNFEIEKELDLDEEFLIYGKKIKDFNNSSINNKYLVMKNIV